MVSTATKLPFVFLGVSGRLERFKPAYYRRTASASDSVEDLKSSHDPSSFSGDRKQHRFLIGIL